MRLGGEVPDEPVLCRTGKPNKMNRTNKSKSSERLLPNAPPHSRHMTLAIKLANAFL